MAAARSTPRVPLAATTRRREAVRLQTLHEYAILDTPPEAAFERIAALAARFLAAPIATVSFVDERRQWLKATCGLPSGDSPRDESFCTHTIRRDEVTVVPDTTLDERFAANPLVVGPPHVRFYAGAPLRAPNGHHLGALCVLDHRPRQLTPEQIQTLRELAATVVDELELRRAGAALRREVTRRERTEARLAETLHSVESLVEARTGQLSRRNEQLRAEAVSRREAEEALRASELQFRELAENVKQVFWMYNADATEQLYISPSYEAVWGRPLSSHKLVGSWIDTVHPDDRERVTADFAARAAAGRYEEEYRVLRPDGAPCWVHDRAFPICDDGGRVYRLAGIATDITERKQQEALTTLRARQQQTVAELGAFALRGGEVKALLEEASRVVREVLAVDHTSVLEHLPEQGVFVVLTADGIPENQRPTCEIPDGTASGSGYVLLTGEPIITEDTLTETRFQVSRWLRDAGMRSGVTVLIGGDSTQLPTFGTFSIFCRYRRTFSVDDVFFLQGIANVLAAAISRRRGEEALAVAKEEAELANSAKSSFLSRMSHELRTPLNAILGFGQLLQMDAATERQRECVRHVLAGGQQLLAMIDDVLDISRLELRRDSPALDAVSVRDAVTTAAHLTRSLAAPKKINVDVQENGALDRAVLVNRQRLNQVLLNLLSNAVKYNREGGQVTVFCREMPSARLRIAVEDTGPGIAAEDFSRLYVPFDRLGAERTDVPGTGLGLALCKNLVEAQGGQIGVESVVGQGSTFWVQLPLAPPSTPVPAAPSPAPPAPGKRRGGRTPARTVLYVEDNGSNLRLIERLLQRRSGVRLLTAANGREGLEVARRDRPDLILLDSHLPDLPGRDVLAVLQADPATCEIPVVVVSADALPASIEAMLAAGARDYLTKPLDVHRLVETMAALGVSPRLDGPKEAS